MQVEHDIKIIKYDDNLQVEIEKMQAEGWRNMPGFAPVIIFQVYRDDITKAQSTSGQSAGFGGQVTMGIDDSKVHIIRAGDKK
jgi:hypothetical protein